VAGEFLLYLEAHLPEYTSHLPWYYSPYKTLIAKDQSMSILCYVRGQIDANKSTEDSVNLPS